MAAGEVAVAWAFCGIPDTPGAEQTVMDRPPPGLARGKLPVPAWVVIALGAGIVLFGVLAFVRRAVARVRR